MLRVLVLLLAASLADAFQGPVAPHRLPCEGSRSSQASRCRAPGVRRTNSIRPPSFAPASTSQRGGRDARGLRLRMSADAAEGGAEWAEPATADWGLPVSFVEGKGSKMRVSYGQVVQASFDAIQTARYYGARKLQVEFPVDLEDEGSTLVGRFEALITYSETLLQKFGLERVERVGENVQIRDNITPGGGGEYLTNEGLFGFRLSNADNSEQVLIVMLAGIDSDPLNQLEKLLLSTSAQPANFPIQVPGTGAMSDLFTIGEVAPMRAGGDATVILVNSGLDKVLAGGMFGFGGPSKFLKEFQPCYLVKRIGAAGFLEFDYRYQGFRLWGVPRDAQELSFQVVSTLEARPAAWEAEQALKAACRS